MQRLTLAYYCDHYYDLEEQIQGDSCEVTEPRE